MTDIKNPNESLCHYFDELLSDDEDKNSSAYPHAEQLSIFPAENLVASTSNGTSNKPTNKATVSPEPIAIKTVAKKIESKAVLTTQNFADPSSDQKQKLQKLLHSVQPEIAVAPKVKTATNEIQEWIIEPTIPVVAEEVATQENIIALANVVHAYQMPGLEWSSNGLPQWAQTRFDVLLFKVSGLTLGVPLISLGKIRPITGELVPLFGQADWFMGLQLTATDKVYTVNTAKFVMPERYDENFAKTAKYVISINGVPWGLAVDSVSQPIRLMPDAVQWRTNRSKRPWLAGTIKEHMCALLDIPMIGQMLMDADKNFAKSQ